MGFAREQRHPQPAVGAAEVLAQLAVHAVVQQHELHSALAALAAALAALVALATLTAAAALAAAARAAAAAGWRHAANEQVARMRVAMDEALVEDHAAEGIN